MPEDYYETLGLKRGASEDDIRKAYREMARKHHPDLNKGDEASKKKFQDVQLAFEVLGDADKRSKYDRFGPGFEAMGDGPGPRAWPGGGGGPGGQPFDVDLGDLFGAGAAAGSTGGFADLFKQFGGGFGGGQPGNARSTAGAARPSRGADLEHTITVPFSVAVAGGETALGVQRADGSSETITVKVPAGIEDGKKLRIKGQGDSAPNGGTTGDLLLTVRVAPHPKFTRRGTRLDVTAPITLAEAALGARIDVPTPAGTVTVSVPPGSSSGKKLRIKGQGVTPAGKPPGDLFVELQIVLPEDLTDAERERLAAVVDGRPLDPRADLRW
ncbi:MAG: J domain-containing protein [Planctomycetota bacterium]